MRRLLFLFLIVAAGILGYSYWRSRALAPSRRVVTPQFRVQQPPLDVNNLAKVLGAATSRALEKGQDLLNQVTDGQAEPVINKTLNNLQEEVKSLPQEQYQKVKYEFCKDVLVSPTPSPLNN